MSADEPKLTLANGEKPFVPYVGPHSAPNGSLLSFSDQTGKGSTLEIAQDVDGDWWMICGDAHKRLI